MRKLVLKVMCATIGIILSDSGQDALNQKVRRTVNIKENSFKSTSLSDLQGGSDNFTRVPAVVVAYFSVNNWLRFD